jgi:hypothetical protein
MKYEIFREVCERIFDPSEIEVRGKSSKDGKSALVLLYIKADSVRKRLDEACEAIGAMWSYDCTYEVFSNTVVARATITVSFDDKVIVRTAIGQEFISESYENEAFKSAETDAFKRAGMRFGIGGYLQKSVKIFERINDFKRFEREEIEIIKEVYAKSKFDVQYVNRREVSQFISDLLNSKLNQDDKEKTLKWLSLKLTTLESKDLKEVRERLKNHHHSENLSSASEDDYDYHSTYAVQKSN